MATPFTVRSMTTSTTTSKSTGTTMSAEAVISAASEVTGGGRGGGRGEAVATVTSEVTGTRGDGDGDDMVMLWVEGVAAAASDEITGAGGAVDRDPPAEQVEAQFEPAWEGGLLSDWLGGL